MMIKRCPKCGEVKMRSQFARRTSSTDGLQRCCKTCCAATYLAWYEANRDKKLAANAAWKVTNRAECLAYYAAYHASHPEKKRARNQVRRARERAALDPTADADAIRELNRKAALASAFMLDEEPLGFAVDHIVPLARGGRHHEDNLRVLPSRLNSVKSAKLDYEVTNPDFHAWLDPRPSFEQVAYITRRG